MIVPSGIGITTFPQGTNAILARDKVDAQKRFTARSITNVLKEMVDRGMIRGFSEPKETLSLHSFVDMGIRCSHMVGPVTGLRIERPNFFVQHLEVDIRPVDLYTEFSHCLE